MLTKSERQALAQVLKHWPKRKAYLFMKTLTNSGVVISTERMALAMLKKAPLNLRSGSPEIVLAALRQQLTLSGIEQAFRDLSAFCRDQGYIYLELLENNPQFLKSLMEEEEPNGFGP